MTMTSQMQAQLRRVVGGYLKDTCIIQRSVATIDSAGYAVVSWQAVGTAAARVTPLTRQDTAGVIADLEGSKTYYNVYMPYDTAVIDGDRILHNGAQYEVLQVSDQQTDTVFTRAIVSREGNE